MKEEELLEERNLINIEYLIQFFLRRKKIIVLTSSVLFSVLFINTIYSYIKKPLYQGSFSILIEDPIENKQPSINSFEQTLALNEYTYKLPTLIQYLKSGLVLSPVANELGLSSKSLEDRIEISRQGTKPFVSSGILKVSLVGKNKIQNMITMEKISKRYLEAASEQRQLKLKSGIDFLNSELPFLGKKTIFLEKQIENFRKKNNILEPLISAQNLQKQKFDIEQNIQSYKLNLDRLDIIKEEILLNKFNINGFIEELSELGINIISSDQKIINEYLSLQGTFAEARTKYKSSSKVLTNIKSRLENLFPEIKEKQLASIELGVKSNISKIKLAEKKLENVNMVFKFQPELLSQYEKLSRDLKIAEANFDSLNLAKEKFRLELAQKAIPWRIIEEPVMQSQPISPNLREEIIKSIFLSIFAGFLLGLLREVLDKVFHNEDEVELILRGLGLSFLGSIPYLKSLKNNDSDDKESNDFLISESFRSLATSIRFFNIANDQSNLIVITSTKQSEGKSTLTSLLAKTFADLGKKVLLIDCDLRRPSVHNFFEKDNIVGLSNYLTDGKMNLENIKNKNIYKNLDIITAGIKPPDPIFLLASEKMNTLTIDLKEDNYDFIFLDAPPSQGLADAKILSQYANLVLYVVGIDDTNKKDFIKTAKFFEMKSDNKVPIAVIANRCKESKSLVSKYGDSYYYNTNLYNYYNSNSSDEEPGNDLETKSTDFDSKFTALKKLINKNWNKILTWIDF